MFLFKSKKSNFLNNSLIFIQIFLFCFYFSYPYINILFIYFLLIEFTVINSIEKNSSYKNNASYYINYLFPKFLVLLFIYLQYSVYQDIFLISIFQILLFCFDKEMLIDNIKRFKESFPDKLAAFWFKFYLFKHTGDTSKFVLIKNSLIIIFIFLLANQTSPFLQSLLIGNLETLKSLFVSVGSGFISATAIVFTLIIFVLQINVERLPYGLFKQLSSDKKILLPFIFALSFSILITSLSLFIEKDFESSYFLFFLILTISIIYLFLYSFKRALLLINPIQQLNMMVDSSSEDLNYAIKLFNRTISASQKIALLEEQNLWPNHDIAKWHFFDKNKNWRLKSEKAIDYSVSFVISNAQKNDYEITSAALNAIVLINSAYIKAKGNTFFQNSIITNPKYHDNFLMYTLEHLRKLLIMAINKPDEQYIEQILNTYVKLTEIYTQIDYPGYENHSKEHAALVVGYFISGVELIFPKQMIDVLMESSIYSGNITKILLKEGDTFHAKNTISLLEKLSTFGAISTKTGPVTQIAMEQLSDILFNSLINRELNDNYFFKDINKAIFNTTKVFLLAPDNQLRNMQTYLDPIYSSFDQNSFLFKLNLLVNQLLIENISEGSVIINNLEQWSEEISQDIKDILLLAVESNSFFTSFIVEWINTISECLLVAVNSPHSSATDKRKLEDNAMKIFAKLTFIPYKKESISFVETFQITNKYFEIIRKGSIRNCNKFMLYVQDNYIYWAFGTSHLITGWDTFKMSILGLCILAIELNELSPTLLKSIIKKHLIRYSSNFNQKSRENLCNQLQNIDLYDRYTSPEICQYINNNNREKIEELLGCIIDIIND